MRRTNGARHNGKTEVVDNDGPDQHTPSNVTFEGFVHKDDSTSSSSSSSKFFSRFNFEKIALPDSLKWIPANWNWSKIKPVIRCAVVAWVSIVIFLIPAVEVWLGQAGFLILIASFLSPPSEPFLTVLEREILILIFATLAWAWSCLGMKLADLARTVHNPTVTLLDAASGKYVEAAPSVILGVFIFFGSAFFLYIKARQGPGPYLFPTVFACICLDTILTTAALYPFPFYQIGRTVIIPLALHSALALVASIFIFPSTISAQFTTRLQGVLTPLISSIELHRKLLTTSTVSQEFASIAADITSAVNKSEAALVPLAASARLLKSDLIYARFAPEDFHSFQQMSRRIVGRANGMGMYFMLIDPTRERFPITPVPSHVHTPSRSLAPSRPHSLERSTLQEDSLGHLHETDDKREPYSQLTQRRGRTESSASSQHSPLASPLTTSRSRPHSSALPHSHSYSHSHSHVHHHTHHNHHHNALLHFGRLRGHRHEDHRHEEHVVGVFESQRYMDLEANRIAGPFDELYTAQLTALLGESCDQLLSECREGLVCMKTWLGNVRSNRVDFWVKYATKLKHREEKLDAIMNIRSRVQTALTDFRNDKRHRVLDPYRPVFEAVSDGASTENVQLSPPHRHLFNCYVYEYHLLRFSDIIIQMLDEVIRLEQERRHEKIWTPVKKFIHWDQWEIPENIETNDDDDPNVIQGLQPTILDDLGMASQRDPDALPPRNWIERIMNHLYNAMSSLGGGNTLFAIKAGLFTVVLCLPSLIKGSAPFAYKNRFSWAIFMGQLTLARFRGDTTFGLIARITSTFLGGVVGMVMWYISCGSGKGNPFGLGVICAVCFPFFFYARLYWPGPPMTNIVFFVTAILVIAYSYQDLHLVTPGSPGFGYNVAWRRFVLVTAGVTAAFIISFLPPSTTIRRYQRHLLATTSSELGAVYCTILSFANSREEYEIQEIITSLIAIRSKLTRSVVLRANAIYEFSFRGRWPAQRYHKIMEMQLQIAYSLSHLMSVLEHLEPAWTRALMRRTRFIDPKFQGDILAVISMISSSLRNGTPLPQITPCPLLDRFMLTYHGLDVIHKESEEDYGLPRSLTLDTLQDEQYMMFCVGVSTAFGIVNRLDRLMLAAKEIVGEQYHIHGVGFRANAKNANNSSGGSTIGVELGPPTSTVHFRPPQDV